MQVEFREFNPFDLWIWIEFETTPSEQEKLYLEQVFESWFYLGKLGAFNAENLQVQDAGLDLNYLDYSEDSHSLMALMHNMGNFEYEGYWGRCWFDLGTSDAIALDVLLNALVQFSKDFVHLERLFIGGENEDWPVEGSDSKPFYEDTN
ncbi:DUF3531 family protein [Altericista sp. CCNU0014]|uniref:DUF3531 family protein n=1 Tax=Altericista sp. CCNU0014 TaxID=3082949 RepID=UPI00384EE7DA